VNSKGFTLIELLAVIVILAIIAVIAVIAVPIVLNIINDTKEIATLRSADFYLDGLEKSIATSTLNNVQIKDGTYQIMYDGNICIGTLENNIESMMNLYNYSENLRKLIYTTNAIESVNSSLRKVTNGKGCFVSREALEKVLYLRVKELSKEWNRSTKSNWTMILNELIELFGEE